MYQDITVYHSAYYRVYQDITVYHSVYQDNAMYITVSKSQRGHQYKQQLLTLVSFETVTPTLSAAFLSSKINGHPPLPHSPSVVNRTQVGVNHCYRNTHTHEIEQLLL